MSSTRNLIVEYYRNNPNSEEKAIDIAKKYNFRPELSKDKRAKAVRDLKRVALNTRDTKQTKPSEDSTTSIHENLEVGSLTINEFAENPRTSDDIIKLHQIDTSIWKLSQYWSKEKSNGWQVSAMFSRKKEQEFNAEDLQDILTDIFSNSKKVSYPPVKTTNNKALFVYMSDKHIGAMTKQDSVYENHYDRMVFAQRLNKVYERIIQAYNDFGTFDTIYICDLGDAVDGWNGLTTRGGHGLPQNMDNKEVFKTYVEEHKKFYDNLLTSGSAKNYKTVIQTNDNHGGDFSYITAKALSYYLEAAYSMEVVLMEKYLEHFEYGEHIFIFTHGKDSEDRKFGLPLQLNDKAENYITKYIEYHNLDRNKNIHLIKGDLHTESMQLTINFRYRNVLSLYGSSKWIHSNFGPGMAGVSFDIVERKSEEVYSFYIKF